MTLEWWLGVTTALEYSNEILNADTSDLGDDKKGANLFKVCVFISVDGMYIGSGRF